MGRLKKYIYNFQRWPTSWIRLTPLIHIHYDRVVSTEEEKFPQARANSFENQWMNTAL